MSYIKEGEYYYSVRKSDAEEGHLVYPPKGYDQNKAYPVVILIPGMGERSGGAMDDLRNLALGWDYDGSGPLPRQYALMTPELKRNADNFQCIMCIVTYPTEFNPNDVNYVLDTVEQHFSVDTSREVIIGFSLGGGAVLKYITSSLANAQRLAFAVAAAPVYWATITKNVVDAGLQFIGTTYETDPRVSANNVKNFVNAIAATVPKAVLITYPGSGHGGFIEIINHPAIYEYLLKTNRENRIQFVAPGTTVPKPIEQPPTESTTVTPVTSYMITGNKIALIGRNSKGYKEGYEGTWAFKSGPSGLTAKQVFPTGSSYIDANGVLPVPGTYVFTFSLKGAEPVELTVQYGVMPVEKKLTGFDSATDLATFDDESTETAKAILSGGRWKVETASGKTYDF